MDHMRISGNEPSSVILSQKSSPKMKSDAQKVPNQAISKPKRMVYKKPHKITISVNFITKNFDALKTLGINQGRP